MLCVSGESVQNPLRLWFIIMVMAQKLKSSSESKKRSGSTPTNPTLYAKVKAEAKKKFKVYPSAYANGWLVKEYKRRGGGYR